MNRETEESIRDREKTQTNKIRSGRGDAITNIVEIKIDIRVPRLN